MTSELASVHTGTKNLGDQVAHNASLVDEHSNNVVRHLNKFGITSDIPNAVSNIYRIINEEIAPEFRAKHSVVQNQTPYTHSSTATATSSPTPFTKSPGNTGHLLQAQAESRHIEKNFVSTNPQKSVHQTPTNKIPYSANHYAPPSPTKRRRAEGTDAVRSLFGTHPRPVSTQSHRATSYTRPPPSQQPNVTPSTSFYNPHPLGPHVMTHPASFTQPSHVQNNGPAPQSSQPGYSNYGTAPPYPY